jgi:hypothetical protein
MRAYALQVYAARLAVTSVTDTRCHHSVTQSLATVASYKQRLAVQPRTQQSVIVEVYGWRCCSVHIANCYDSNYAST